jgi:hypothetical protein
LVPEVFDAVYVMAVLGYEALGVVDAMMLDGASSSWLRSLWGKNRGNGLSI